MSSLRPSRSPDPSLLLPAAVFALCLELAGPDTARAAPAVSRSWRRASGEAAAAYKLWRRLAFGRRSLRLREGGPVARGAASAGVDGAALFSDLESLSREALDGVALGGAGLWDVAREGVEESSTDEEGQGVGRTCGADGARHFTFWSSAGSQDEASGEHLVFRLEGVCAVAEVNLRAFCARFQPGSPCFPPRQVRVRVGMAPGQWHYEGQVRAYGVRDDSLVRVTLCDELVVGRYVRVDLLGRVTRQPGDDLFYTAVERVRVLGLAQEDLARDRPALSAAVAAAAAAAADPDPAPATATATANVDEPDDARAASVRAAAGLHRHAELVRRAIALVRVARMDEAAMLMAAESRRLMCAPEALAQFEDGPRAAVSLAVQEWVRNGANRRDAGIDYIRSLVHSGGASFRAREAEVALMAELDNDGGFVNAILSARPCSARALSAYSRRGQHILAIDVLLHARAHDLVVRELALCDMPHEAARLHVELGMGGPYPRLLLSYAGEEGGGALAEGRRAALAAALLERDDDGLDVHALADELGLEPAGAGAWDVVAALRAEIVARIRRAGVVAV